MTRFDYIVVGGGSAGCVLAARLSENPGHRVLLLEAGPTDRNLFVQVPAGVKQLNADFNWRYEAEPDSSRGGTVEKWAAGRLLGGSSSINGMMWVRGHAADYDAWAADGAAGWDHASLEPYFRRAEHYETASSDLRGFDGPLHVTPVRVDHPVTDLFLEGAQKAGHPYREDYNGAVQEGVGYSQVTQRRGWRHSTARSHLARAARRRNLTVRTGAEAQRVLLSGSRAVGVEFRRRGRLETAHADAEVILSAGTFATPRVLMASGIGPADHLRDNGIAVVADLPVGRNLQEHPITLFLHQLDIRTLNQELTPGRVLRHGADYLLRGRGAVASPSCHAMVFAGRSDSGATRYQMMFSPFGVVGKPSATRVEGADPGPGSGDPLDGPLNHDVNAMKLLPQSSVTTYPCVLHPASRGSVRLRPGDPTGRPVIDMQLLAERSDVEDMIAACRMLREIYAAEPLAGHVVAELKPGRDVQTDADWEAYLRGFTFRAEHGVGTARMGSDDRAVTDPQLRVRGIEGLRVVDASVFPTLVSGNTNAAVVAVAERASDVIRGLAGVSR